MPLENANHMDNKAKSAELDKALQEVREARSESRAAQEEFRQAGEIAAGKCRCQNRRISSRGSRTMRLGSMVTGDRGHNVYPGSGPLYGVLQELIYHEIVMAKTLEI